MRASLKGRRVFYHKIPEYVTSVLCFGNVPPPIRLDVPVYTYFHNINMLTLSDCRNFKQKVMYWLKRTYIKANRNNTDNWFVQTTNTAKELIKNLNVKESLVSLYPFYRIPKFQRCECERIDYIFVGDDTGSKGHKELIEAWKILHSRGVYRTLHLTVSSQSPLYNELNNISEGGPRIINHGLIPLEEVFSLYARCRAIVYPSRNESLGLGIIEAIESGCDVIASDLPFVYAICEPSEVFDRRDPNSIADAIVHYEEVGTSRSIIMVSDKVYELIDVVIR